jgi:hypothetical protein
MRVIDVLPGMIKKNGVFNAEAQVAPFCILRPDKDRGKDVESAPRYKLGPHYGGNEGDRINDHHLSLKEKKKVRVEKTVGGKQ